MIEFIREYQINDLDLCDQIIDHCKNEYEKGNTKAGVFSVGITDKKIKDSEDLTLVNKELRNRYHSYLDTFIKDYIEFIDLDSYNGVLTYDTYPNIQWYKPNSGYHAWHIDSNEEKRAVTFITYLNDVPDGGTEFKLQNKLVKAKKGKTVIFPASITHIHRGQISKTSNKYILTGWLDWQ